MPRTLIAVLLSHAWQFKCTILLYWEVCCPVSKAILEQFSADCGKTSRKPVKVIFLANHKGRIQYSEPIKT